jgi:hypothetical protein
MGVPKMRHRIVAHRGAWKKELLVPNSQEALLAALEAGFSIETDLRDRNGTVVISHDPTTDDSALTLRVFLDQVFSVTLSGGSILALNIKSDGLNPLMKDELRMLEGISHFFFDMSTPELVKYAKAGQNVGLRRSEFEILAPQLSICSEPSAVWVDGFDSDWWKTSDLLELGSRKRVVVLVSPELHGRDPAQVWKNYAEEFHNNPNLYICTDYPWEVLEMIEVG